MTRLVPFAVALLASVAIAGCGGSDDDPDPITRIDGPATVDEEILEGGDGSSDG